MTAPTGRVRQHRVRQVGWVLYRNLGLPIIGVTVAVGAWWSTVRFFEIRPSVLPAPPDVAGSLRDNASYLSHQAWVTVLETLVGFTAGAAGGLLAAGVLATWSTLERAALPLVVGLNAVPKVALAPLVVLWWGLGHAPKIALAAASCFFPVMIATTAGLASTPAELDELARSLRATRWQRFTKIQLPWGLPQVFVGLKLGITLALIGTVVAQLVRPSSGLGTAILRAVQTVDIPLAFAAIALLMAMSIMLFYAVVVAERLLLRWARHGPVTPVAIPEGVPH